MHERNYDSFHMHKKIKEMTGARKTFQANHVIKSADGRIITDVKEKVTRWETYVQELFNDERPTKVPIRVEDEVIQYQMSTIMERYANAVDRNSSVLILQFYQKLREASKNYPHDNSTERIEAGYWLKEFKNHFEIEVKYKGEV